MCAFAMPVTAHVVVAEIAAQLASLGPGQVAASVWLLIETGMAAAPAPEFVAPAGMVIHVLLQSGSGGAAESLLATSAVTSAFEPPSQSTQPAPFDSIRMQTQLLLAWLGCCAPITTGAPKVTGAIPFAPIAPPTSCIGPDPVKLPRVKLQIAPMTPPVGRPRALRNDPGAESAGQSALLPVAIVKLTVPRVGTGV